MATLDWVPASGRLAPPPLLCREGVYWACDSVALAVGLHRVNLVVVGSVRRKAFHAHAEHRIGMGRVQPDVRFRGLAQVLGIRAVVYNPKVFGRAPPISETVYSYLHLKENYSKQDDQKVRNHGRLNPRSPAPARPLASGRLRDERAGEERPLVFGHPPLSVLRSRNWLSRQRRNVADGRCAGRKRRRSRDKEAVSLPRR